MFLRIEAIFLLKTPNDCIALYIRMDETPKFLVPCAIAGICRKATQLRNELAAVSEQQSNSMRELYSEGSQLKVALKAMDDAISKLQECGNTCGNPMPMARQEPISTTPLSLIERASLFQSWDMKRKHQEQHRSPAQQQKAAKTQT